MSSAALEVQTAIFAILDADVTLSALVTGVFDDVPESYTDFPYVTLGEDVLTEFDTDGVLGFRVSVTIHCWSQYKGQRETKQVQDAIYRALHHLAMTVPGYNMVLSRQVDQTSERDPDGMTRHGVQTFELLVREDVPVIPSSSILSPLNANLVVMYTMDRVTGGVTLVDESANGNDATITSAVQIAGHIGNALDFSPSASAVAATPASPVFSPSGGLSGDVAFSFWVETASVASFAYILNTLVDSAGEKGFGIHHVAGGSLTFQLAGHQDIAFGYTLPTGTYTHIVFNYERNQGVELIADNVSKGTGVNFATPTSVTNHPLTLGKHPDFTTFAFAGQIDQFRLFDRLLTTDEIAELFNSGAGA
jgi:hypothetical protein